MADNNAPQKPKSAAAIVGLVLGIIALVTSFLPFINNLSFVLAAIGLVFAIVGLAGELRGKKVGKGMAIASVVVNVLAVVIVLGTQSMYAAAIDDATASLTSNDAAATLDATAAADKYSITDEAMDGDAYSTKISGILTNNTNDQLSYVQVSYNLFDADGNQIGTALANTNNLAADGTWKFEAAGMTAVDKVANYKLGDVSGF